MNGLFWNEKNPASQNSPMDDALLGKGTANLAFDLSPSLKGSGDGDAPNDLGAVPLALALAVVVAVAKLFTLSPEEL